MNEQHDKALVVVSAINIFKGGSLTIAREFLKELDGAGNGSHHGPTIIVFCHACDLYKDLDLKRTIFIEKPWSRKNWIMRLLYEYVWFWFWSRKKTIDSWVSLHDITPNVNAKRQYVYCHNPAPFYSGGTVWRYEPSFELFRLFYKYLYRINIRKNKGVIVQQQWLRAEFIDRYKIEPEKVIVALPERSPGQIPNKCRQRDVNKAFIIIYPALPRPFKNFEVLLEAMILLKSLAVKLIVTIDGQENRYARNLYERYKILGNVEFAGYMNHSAIAQLYAKADAMVFPSKLETWGLPMSEFKCSGKPIIAADLPYAHETLFDYAHKYYFEPNDHVRLAAFVETLYDGSLPPQPMPEAIEYDQPMARNWQELLGIMALN
jgi:glycosyltransferase involved in cell wall biosynthesis